MSPDPKQDISSAHYDPELVIEKAIFDASRVRVGRINDKDLLRGMTEAFAFQSTHPLTYAQLENHVKDRSEGMIWVIETKKRVQQDLENEKKETSTLKKKVEKLEDQLKEIARWADAARHFKEYDETRFREVLASMANCINDRFVDPKAGRAGKNPLDIDQTPVKPLYPKIEREVDEDYAYDYPEEI